MRNPFHLALANGLIGTDRAYRGEASETLTIAESTIRICEEYGILHWLSLGTLWKGWALCKLGQTRDGLGLLQEGIRRWQSTGAQMVVPTFLAFQSDAYLTAQQVDKALISIEEGLKLSKRMEELYYDAELYRLRGEALLQKQGKHQRTKANSKEVESCFLQATKIAREQRANSLELRATTSLARLWQVTGMEKEARKALSKICNWFSEGFDTPDFRNAKSLLNELS